ncbi:unnamed protein product [Haemonchus placei]|uniref:Uncharacterized protein n=1 Tax=Haemonchus placei TaxID=6290 RepID=A0A3P8A3I1_HAEPC|nr:unnamed protein product [Haemonchus placei]
MAVDGEAELERVVRHVGIWSSDVPGLSHRLRRHRRLACRTQLLSKISDHFS